MKYEELEERLLLAGMFDRSLPKVAGRGMKVWGVGDGTGASGSGVKLAGDVEAWQWAVDLLGRSEGGGALTAEEKRVLWSRYGLGVIRPWRAVSEQVGMSVERCRKIARVSMGKLMSEI